MMLWARLITRDFRFHPLHWLLSILGIAIGVGGWIGMEAATNQATTAFEQSIDATFGQATHVIENRAGLLSEEAYFDLAGHFSGKMAPLIETYGEARGRAASNRSHPSYVRVLGIDPLSYIQFQEGVSSSSLPFDELIAGEPVAVASSDFQSDFEVGDAMRIKIKGISRSVQILGFLDDSSIKRTIFMDVGLMQQYFELDGELSRILLKDVSGSSDDLETQLDEASILLPIGSRTQSVRSLLTSFRANLRALSFLSLFVGGFLVYSTMYLYALRQVHLISLLRAIGAGEGETCRFLFGGLAVVAVVGSLTGVIIGGILSGPLGSMVSGTVDQLYVPLFSEATSIPPLRALGGFLLGVATSLIGGFKPIYDRLGVAPREWERLGLKADGRRVGNSPLFWLGIAAWLVAPAIAFIDGGLNAAFFGCFLIAFGGSVMSPFFLGAISRIPFRGTWAQLAARNVRAYRSWTGVMVSVLVAAFSLVLSVSIMVDSFRGSVNGWIQNVVKADFYVRTVPAGENERGISFGSDFIARLRTIDGIADIALSAEKTVLMRDGNPITLRGIEPEVLQRRLTFQFNDTAGKPWEGLRRGEIWLSQPGSHRTGKSAGDRLALPTDKREDVVVTIGAVYNDYSTEWAVGYMSLSQMRELYDDARVSSAAVFTDSDSDSGPSRSELEALTEEFGYYLDSQRGLKRKALAEFDRTFAVTDVMGMVASVVAGIGLLVLLISFTRARSWVFGRMAAVGASRSQLIRLILIESLLIGLGAVLVAIPTGIYLSSMLIAVINKRAFGWLIPFELSLAPFATLAVLVLLTVLAATLFPVYRLMTVPLSELLQEGRR